MYLKTLCALGRECVCNVTAIRLAVGVDHISGEADSPW